MLKKELLLIGLVVQVCILGKTCISQAQEIDETRNQQKNYVDFSGGLNTKNSDFIIGSNEGTVYDNVILDTVEGALKKRNSFLTAYTSPNTDSPTSIHRLYLADATKVTLKTGGNKLEACDDNLGTCSDILDLSVSGNNFDWITYNNLAIGTDGFNSPIKTNGADATFLGSVYPEDAESGAGPDGDYTYKVTFYTTSYEVGFEVESPSISVVDNDIDLTMIPIAVDTYLGEDILGRRIYRTSDGGSDYKLLSNGDISDNFTVELTDSDTDAERTTAYPTVDDTCTPPKTKLIHLFESRVFMGNNPDAQSRVYWSEITRPECFLSDQFVDIRLDDGDQITVLETWLSNLAISKENSWQYLYTSAGDPLTTWNVSDPYTPKGCRAIYTAVTTPLGIFFLAGDGIYNFNGQYALLLSDKISPTIETIDQANRGEVYGAFTNNKYYMTYADSTTGESINNRTLVYDTISKSYSIFTIGFSAFDVFSSGSDDEILYSGSIDDGSVLGFTEANYEILHRKHSDFTGDFTDMRYFPERWGGDPENAELEISWDKTINELVGSIDTLQGIVDRETDNGTYISQFLTLNATSLGKLYWNESIPSQGGDFEFFVRSGPTTTDTLIAPWSGPYTDATGSDLSAASTDTLTQYKIEATADNIKFSPNLISGGGYVVKLTYNKAKANSEDSIPFKWSSGIDFLKAPGYNKELTYLEAEFEGEGEFVVKFTNEFGDTDSFTIDMDTYTDGYYKGAFLGGKFVAKRIRVEVTKNDLSDFVLKRLGVIYDVNLQSVERIEL